MSSHATISPLLQLSLGQTYLDRRSHLLRRISDEYNISSIMIITEHPKSINWLASKLRMIFGRSVAILFCHDPRLFGKMWKAASSELIIADLDQSQFWIADSYLRQAQSIGMCSRLVVLSEHLSIERRQQLLRIGINKHLHKDDADVSSILKAVLG